MRLDKGHNENSTTCKPHQILVRWQFQGQWNVRAILRVWGRSEIHIGFWWRNQKKRHYIEGICRIFIILQITHSLLRGLENNVKMHPEEMGRHGMDKISVTQRWEKWQAFVNTVTKLWVPENDANFLITYLHAILGCDRHQVVVEVFAVLGYGTMSIFSDSVSVPSSRFKKPVLPEISWPLYKYRNVGTNYQSPLRIIPEERKHQLRSFVFKKNRTAWS